MNDEQEKYFWDRISKATTPQRTSAQLGEQRAKIRERLSRKSRAMWVFVAAPVLAAAAFVLHNFSEAPKPGKTVQVAKNSVTGPVVAKAVEEEDTDWDIRATAVTGEVVVTSKDGVDSLLAVDAPLEAWDKIEVPSDGSLEIAFAADSVMTFNAGARLMIGSIAKKDSFFELTFGTLVAKLNWAKRRGYKMQIRTPTAVAAVRGTEFAVDVHEDGMTDIGVFDEGKIAVTDRRNRSAKEVIVTPHREIRFEAKRMHLPRKLQKMKRLSKHFKHIARLNKRQKHLKNNWKRMNRKNRQKWRKQHMSRPDGPWKDKLRQRREQRREGIEQRRRKAAKDRLGNRERRRRRNRPGPGMKEKLRRGGQEKQRKKFDQKQLQQKPDRRQQQKPRRHEPKKSYQRQRQYKPRQQRPRRENQKPRRQQRGRPGRTQNRRSGGERRSGGRRGGKRR